jgi:hypothetical protein
MMERSDTVQSTQIVKETSVTSEYSDAMAASRVRLPGYFFVLLIIALPVIIFGLLPIWEQLDGKILVLLSGSLFILVCAVPIVHLIRTRAYRTSITLMVILLAYLIDFGVRAIYFVLSPDVVLYPNFNPSQDMLYLHRGLLWATVGILSLIGGYYLARNRLSRQQPERSVIVRRFTSMFQGTSSLKFLLALYGLGLIGRLYAITSGAAIWLYNSPIFDTFATRPDPFVSGPLSVLSEFCPLAFAGVFAWHIWHSKNPGVKPRLSAGLVIVMFAIEILYFSFGLYKFGVVSTLLIMWAVPTILQHGQPLRGIIAIAAFGLIVLPVFNVARGALSGFYTNSNRPTGEWFALMQGAVETTYQTPSGDSFKENYIDPLFERLNGAEALAVAEKYLPKFNYEGGKTYWNLVRLSVPRILRGEDAEPDYINWAADYAGLNPSNPTVIPLPALVEAYLNFGIAGVVVVMFLLGVLYRYADLFTATFRNYPMAIGISMFMIWRFMNIEHYLFILLPAVFKTLMVVLILSFVYSQLFKAKHIVNRTSA